MWTLQPPWSPCWVSPYLPFPLPRAGRLCLSLPPLLRCLSQTPFPAILHQRDNRTMGLLCSPSQVLLESQGPNPKEAGPQGGVQMLATCQGLSRGDVMGKMA